MVGLTIKEAVIQYKGMETAWLDRSCRKNNILPEEICCQKRYVARGDMLPEEICCRRSNVAGGDAML